jgi:hypothetical protein
VRRERREEREAYSSLPYLSILLESGEYIGSMAGEKFRLSPFSLLPPHSE